MKNARRITIALAFVLGLVTAQSVMAQYAQIANQLTNLISPALSGSGRYKGYVDLNGNMGIGHNRMNNFGISTTQGYQYSSWFFMGAGIGVDVATSGGDTDFQYGVPTGRPTSRTRVMVPVFTDFRFNIGQPSSPSFFIDIKAGAAWIMGNRYLRLTEGALSNRTQFLLRPTLGVRVPINSQNAKQAVNIGLTYQLITANNSWGYWGGHFNPTLNSLGLNVGYEW